MAYRLKGRKPVDAELARIVAKEFDKAQARLDNHADRDPDEAIHDARKGVKKIRAVLRLLQKPLGSEYDAHDQELRDLSHQLSSLRDLDATLEIFEAVRAHYPKVVTPSISAPVRQALLRRKSTASARLHADRLLPRALHVLRGSATATTKDIHRAAAKASVRAGVLRGYRRAQAAMAEVRTRPEDVAFHTWRRRVKDHEYHVRLMEGLSARARARAQQLKRLETWLGDDHNLVLMRSAVLGAPAAFGGTRATALVLGCAETYQATLRRRALKLGERLFSRKPRFFRRSIERWLRRR